MYEDTVESILEKDPITSKSFIGALARNELPTKIKYPTCFILNTQPRHKAGEHWLALYFDKYKTCYFFDSYGLHPNHYKLTKYIKKHADICKFSKRRLQGSSNYCGMYCIQFLKFKLRNKSKDFFDKFYSNYEKNDDYIEKFLNKNSFK